MGKHNNQSNVISSLFRLLSSSSYTSNGRKVRIDLCWAHVTIYHYSIRDNIEVAWTNRKESYTVDKRWREHCYIKYLWKQSRSSLRVSVISTLFGLFVVVTIAGYQVI